MLTMAGWLRWFQRVIPSGALGSAPEKPSWTWFGAIFAGVLILCPASKALAIPLTWTLGGATFDDSSSFTGSFVFDADTVTFSAVSITTLPGNAPGATYLTSDLCSSAGLCANAQPPNGIALVTPALDLLLLGFAAPLTNAGGVVALTTAFPTTEGFCFVNQLCAGGNGLRGVLTGFLTASPASVSVPAPGSMLIFAFGLAGLGVAMWRRRA